MGKGAQPKKMVLHLNLLTSLHRLLSLYRQLLAQDFDLAPNLPALFHQVYSVLSLKEQVDQCDYRCSEASLALLPPFPWRTWPRPSHSTSAPLASLTTAACRAPLMAGRAEEVDIT